MIVDRKQILWDLRQAEHKRGTSAPTFAVCGRAADYIEELEIEIANLQSALLANRMADHLEETYGSKRAIAVASQDDVLTNLLKKVGIQIVKEAYLVLVHDRFMTDEERIFMVDNVNHHFHEKGLIHQAVGTFKDSPRRIVYDEDFGCMWYNSEGPEE